MQDNIRNQNNTPLETAESSKEEGGIQRISMEADAKTKQGKETTVREDASIRFCPNCGAEVSDSEKFCHSCGMELKSHKR